MRGKGRVPTELVRRREQAALDLAAKGLSETEIADELDKQGLGQVTQQAVSKMLIRVEKRQLAEISEQVKLMKVRQTASLRKIHRDAIAAWEESKKPQKSTHWPTSARSGAWTSQRRSLQLLPMGNYLMPRSSMPNVLPPSPDSMSAWAREVEARLLRGETTSLDRLLADPTWILAQAGMTPDP